MDDKNRKKRQNIGSSGSSSSDVGTDRRSGSEPDRRSTGDFSGSSGSISGKRSERPQRHESDLDRDVESDRSSGSERDIDESDREI